MRALEWITNQPWAILPESLQTIIRIAGRENESVEAVAAKLGRPLDNTRTVEVRDGVAIVPVSGPIMRYANLFSQISGATSIDILATDFRTALDNPDIKAIILGIDSPGGMVTGVNEFADMVYAARGTKPITAYVSGMGASAAYWIASAADQIVLDATASLGSIGVVTTYSDNKDQRKKAGINDIEIVSSQSPRKRPDISTDEGRAQVQTQMDAIAEVFVNAVARNRGVTQTSVLSDFGQGGLMVGVDAVASGLADRIGSLEETIAGLSGTTQRGFVMAQTIKAETPEITQAYILENYPQIAESIRTDAYQKGLQEGITQERERIKAVEEQLMPGHEALISALKFDGKTTAAEAAMKVLAAEKQQRSNVLQNLHADAPQPLPQPSVAPFENKPKEEEEENLPMEEQCKAKWQRSPQLRAEFGTLEGYVAYTKAYSNGQVKILRNSINQGASQ